MNFAHRQQQAGRLDLAASAYQALAATDLPGRQRAQACLDAMQGRGSVGRRLEFLLGQFAEQTTDPGMLGGMVVASTVFQGVRLLGLSRLLANPGAGLLTRGAGARLAAASLGFAAEVPSFLFASKAIHQAMGREQDWSSRALAREAAGLGLNLFFLKACGGLARGGLEAWQGRLSPLGGAEGFSRLPNILLPQAASLAGIYLGHRAEVLAGLKPATDDATTLVDSLSLLLQFHLGGQLSAQLMGPGFSRHAQALEWLARNAAPRPKSLGPGAFQGEYLEAMGRRPALAMPEISRVEVEAEGHPFPKWKVRIPEPLRMSQVGDGESSSFKFLEGRLRTHLISHYEPGLEADAEVRERFSTRVDEIAFNYLRTPGVDLQRYYQLLMEARLADIPHDDGRVTARVEQLAVATKYFRHAMEMNTFRRGVGSLYDHLMQETFERVLREGGREDFEAFIRVASVQRRIEAVESYLQERGWDRRYAFAEPPKAPEPPATWLDRLRARFDFAVPKPAESPPPWLARLRAMAISPEAKAAVGKYLRSYELAEPAAAFRDGVHNFILWRPAQGAERREAFTVGVAMDGLGDYLRAWKRNPEHLRVLEDAIRRASRSTVPVLHFDRIFKLLATRDLPHKIAEVASQEAFHWGQLEGILDLSSGETGYDSSIAKLNGTIYTGYIYDRVLAEKFARLYHLTPIYLHPTEMQIRLGQFHYRAKELLEDKVSAALTEWMRERKRATNLPPSPAAAQAKRLELESSVVFDGKDILSMLGLRPTPVASKAVAAIERGEVELRLLAKPQMRELWKNLPHDEQDKEPPEGLFVPAEKSPSRKPLIAITALDPDLTRDQKIVRSIALAALVVHEFEHYLHRGELNNVHLSEMRAWLEEYLFMMQNGQLALWHEMQETTPYGFGVYLRSLVDKDYIEGPRDVPIRLKK